MTKDSHNNNNNSRSGKKNRQRKKQQQRGADVLTRYCWKSLKSVATVCGRSKLLSSIYLFFSFFFLFLWTAHQSLYLTLYPLGRGHPLPPLLWNCSLVTAYRVLWCVSVFLNSSSPSLLLRIYVCFYVSFIFYVFTVEGNRKPLIINVINDRQWSYPVVFSLPPYPPPCQPTWMRRLPFNATQFSNMKQLIGKWKTKTHDFGVRRTAESSFFLIIRRERERDRHTTPRGSSPRLLFPCVSLLSAV